MSEVFEGSSLPVDPRVAGRGGGALWYYDGMGTPVGVSFEQLSAAVQSGHVNARTLVWHSSLSGWVPLGETVLERFLPGRGVLGVEGSLPAPGVEPVAGSAVVDDGGSLAAANAWAWVLTLLPAVAAVVHWAVPDFYNLYFYWWVGSSVVVFAVVLNVERVLTRRVTSESFGSFWLGWFLPPFYLFKRSRVLGLPQGMCLTWVSAFVASTVGLF